MDEFSEWTEGMSRKKRIFMRLCAARNANEWVKVNEMLKYASESTIRSALRRLLKAGLIEKMKIPQPKGRWVLGYRATDKGLIVQKEGGLPSTPPKGKTETKVLEVAVRSIDEILDTSAMAWEVLQYSIRVDGYSEAQMRKVCNPPKKGSRDRAKQVSYSEADFAITVSKGGKCFISLKSHTWEKPFREWIAKSGLSLAQAKNILSQVKNQLPFGMARIEIPVLEQMVEELRVRCNVRTEIRDEFVETNINYSLGKIGLEFFGGYRWVETLVQIIAALQHTTMVSEVRRDQFIADMMALLEAQRKERELKEESETAPKEDKDESWRNAYG
jgi:hypothetical protein